MDSVVENRCVTAKAHIPEIITKELGMARLGDTRKVRLSTNFLPLMGFEAGTRHSVEVLPGLSGMRVAFDTHGPQKIYMRQYKTRRNNPFETQLEVSNQAKIDAAFPGWTERLHYTMRHGEILIRPLANRTFSIRRNLLKEDNPFTAMVAMTSGLDVRCLEDCGFEVSSVLEFRPPEARDKRDLTESGVLSILANSKPSIVFAEDITKISWDHVAKTMESVPQVAVAHISLQCDDFTTLKTKAMKKQHEDNLEGSSDLVIDALRMIDVVRPATVICEQVRGFSSSFEGNLLRTRLRRMGYHVTDSILRANEFGGKSGRQRFYMVASVFPGFAMPEPTGARVSPLWPEIARFFDGCRDISHTQSLKDGVASGRARLITPESLFAGTILKSQARQAKDSLVIAMPDGRYLLPSTELLRFLQSIPEDFSFDNVAGEQMVEQIGQSICFDMHHAVCAAVHKHIGENVGRHTVLSIANGRSVPIPTGGQIALF